MPVDVRELVAEERVVDLDRVKLARERLSDPSYFVHQARALRGRELEELGGVPIEHEHGPAGKELVIVQIRRGEAAVRDTVRRPRPRAGAGHTASGAHDRVR